jgi:hypothetical protein
MRPENVWNDFVALPAEAQRQAADFIAFLRQRYQVLDAGRRTEPSDLNSEPFIGMWQDREDMQDSTAWVRSVRQQEWTKQRG